MSDSMLQSTLREMQVIGRSGRLWLTFGAVVLLFAVTGPYDTADRLAFLPRLAYWLLLHAGAWFFALSFAVIADILLKTVIRNMFARMLLGSLLAALPIGLVIGLSDLSWFGTPLTLYGYIAGLVVTLPLSAIFCVISYMAMSSDPGHGSMPEKIVAPQVNPETTLEQEIPLLARLAPFNRGMLRHISVEDHYSRIRTSRGSELVLLRFGDALRETGSVDGLQVHRSHWVARDFVEGTMLQHGKLLLLLKDGTEIPVSRTYAATVRQEFSRISGDHAGESRKTT